MTACIAWIPELLGWAVPTGLIVRHKTGPRGYWVPGRGLWACLVGVVLVAIGAIAGGLGLVVEKTKRWAALLSGGMIFTWFVILHIPRALAAPHDTNEWSSVCESLAVSGMAFLLAATSSTAAERTPDAFPA